MTNAPEPTIIEFLSAWAKDNDVMKRSRIPTEKKILGAILCFSGYTYRDASKLLGGISHVAIHDAHKAMSAALPPLPRKSRTVTIDENITNLNNETRAAIWIAKDLDSGEILSVRCSATRSSQDQKKFIDSVLATCMGRPLLRVGRGPSYPSSLKSLDLYFTIDTTATSTFRRRISNFFLGGSEPRT